MIVYDHGFNSNEWFIIIGVCIGIVLMILLPKRFSRKKTTVYFMFGVFTGFFFDHTLSVNPVSYYDVNDLSSFQVMDFVSYWMYGPVSYLFFYVMDCLRIKPVHSPIYILIWAMGSTGVEWAAVAAGVFHYRLGYKLPYSFPIYLLAQSLWVVFFYRYQRTSTNRRRVGA
jgi:hypothetical protein